jgi:hypothetical protein
VSVRALRWCTNYSINVSAQQLHGNEQHIYQPQYLTYEEWTCQSVIASDCYSEAVKGEIRKKGYWGSNLLFLNYVIQSDTPRSGIKIQQVMGEIMSLIHNLTNEMHNKISYRIRPSSLASPDLNNGQSFPF